MGIKCLRLFRIGDEIRDFDVGNSKLDRIFEIGQKLVSLKDPMSSSSSSSRSSSSDVRYVHGFNRLSCIRRWNEAAKDCGVKSCQCGLECEFYTSMTNENPGRRFYRCPKYSRGGCRMWEWFDAPMCPAASKLIPLLREEISELRSTLKINSDIIEGCELELRDCHSKIARMKEEFELCNGETETCLQEMIKLRSERSLMEDEIQSQKMKMKMLFRVIWLFALLALCLSLYVVRKG